MTILVTLSCSTFCDPTDGSCWTWGNCIEGFGLVFFFFLINLFIYLFIYDCARSLLLIRFFSSCSDQGLLSNCGAQASHCSGFSCCRARALRVGFSSCGSWALEHRFSSCSVVGLSSSRHLSRLGVELESYALAGGFFTTREAPGLILKIY